MPKTALYNMEGKAIGEIELSEEIFAAPINEAAMHLMVRSYLAAQRQGTQSALSRGEGCEDAKAEKSRAAAAGPVPGGAGCTGICAVCIFPVLRKEGDRWTEKTESRTGLRSTAS